MVISINKADYAGEYKIRFIFSDGIERTVDFSDFLENAKNPMTRKYLDKKLFEGFSIDYGDIIWNDYEMCFPIWDLHEGEIWFRLNTSTRILLQVELHPMLGYVFWGGFFMVQQTLWEMRVWMFLETFGIFTSIYAGRQLGINLFPCAIALAVLPIQKKKI